MRKPWNLPSYPVYSLITEKWDDKNQTVEKGNFQKQEVQGSEDISQWVYWVVNKQEKSETDDEIRSFSRFPRNMNVMTYVVPVSMSPKHYIIALYHDTESLSNWQSSHRGILQILAPTHSPLVRVLGKKSWKTYDKMTYLAKKWLLSGDSMIVGIAWYIELEEVEKLWDGGWDHDLYLCRVVSSRSYHEDVLTTEILVEEGVIL
jgi:flavin reductase (DIM6/NTAB) family NADH-FMN oxidoreductase RutF